MRQLRETHNQEIEQLREDNNRKLRWQRQELNCSQASADTIAEKDEKG